jgi:Mlc titration factor MtfA (ptsG expression regulator)
MAKTLLQQGISDLARMGSNEELMAGLFSMVGALAVAAGVAAWAWRGAMRNARRREWLAAPFPDAWAAILETTLPPYPALSNDERRRLHGTINVFLGEKHFEGCGGLELTDEMRVTIAAQACMLLLNRPAPVYPKLRTVLVYPSTYVADREDGGTSVRLGESWNLGVVVLAWNSVKGGAANFSDGHNVTLHEFAHQLDQEDGAGDGAPILETRSAYRTWAEVLTREYRALRKQVSKGRRTVMDRYGATNPAEFFAVATETFFEKPRQLQKKHPELYDELKGYYHTDPLAWDDTRTS